MKPCPFFHSYNKELHQRCNVMLHLIAFVSLESTQTSPCSHSGRDKEEEAIIVNWSLIHIKVPASEIMDETRL